MAIVATEFKTARTVQQIRKSVLLPYSTERMFALVARVPDYPQFMPWCGGAREDLTADGLVRATLQIDYHGVKSSFTTLNRNSPPDSIALQFAEGPFAVLDGLWSFTALASDACKVQFELNYEFAGGVLGKLVAPVFDVVANSFIDAFARRAEALYG
jgi:ribosome-associated toxin RatA of RatAB toxin-antitoxin module